MDCDSGRTLLFDHPVPQNDQRLPCSPEVLDSLWISNSPSFHGDSGSCSNSIINFAAAADNTNNNNGQFVPNDTKIEENDINENNEDCDVYFHKPEKKRRLKSEQVHSLEKIFEVDNKLEPDRKVELANELGLHPRQVAIWFQNRRARFKTKQLEKDYASLKASYDKLQSDHGSLLQESERLRNQVLQLKEKLKNRSISDSYPDYEMGSDSQKTESNEKAAPPPPPPPAVKTEDVSSTKSDVVDSESPHWVEGRNHWCSTSSHMEVAESYQVVSGEEEEDDVNNKKSVYVAPCFPKVEEGEYYSDPSANCCNWEFQVEEQPSSWFWPY